MAGSGGRCAQRRSTSHSIILYMGRIIGLHLNHLIRYYSIFARCVELRFSSGVSAWRRLLERALAVMTRGVQLLRDVVACLVRVDMPSLCGSAFEELCTLPSLMWPSAASPGLNWLQAEWRVFSNLKSNTGVWHAWEGKTHDQCMSPGAVEEIASCWVSANSEF